MVGLTDMDPVYMGRVQPPGHRLTLPGVGGTPV